MRAVRIEAEVPDESPPDATEWIDSIRSVVEAEDLAEETPFLQFLDRSLTVEWSESGEDRLGHTRFEMSHADLERRRITRMPPGPVTIFLHPILARDARLLAHTYVHELLHAAGMTGHDARHDELVGAIAPMPTLSESQILQELRGVALAEQQITAWTCDHCGFDWPRSTLRPPLRCPKCARRFR